MGLGFVLHRDDDETGTGKIAKQGFAGREVAVGGIGGPWQREGGRGDLGDFGPDQAATGFEDAQRLGQDSGFVGQVHADVKADGVVEMVGLERQLCGIGVEEFH